MASSTPLLTPFSKEERLAAAQKAFEEYRTRCFWSMPDDFVVTDDNLFLIIEGLKLHGGHSGWRVAHRLCP